MIFVEPNPIFMKSRDRGNPRMSESTFIKHSYEKKIVKLVNQPKVFTSKKWKLSVLMTSERNCSPPCPA